MLHRFTHITFLTTVVILVLTCRILPGLADTNSSGALVLDLINQYREEPYAHGITLGYDPLTLEAIGILPDTRFDPYEADDILNQAAAAANTHATSSEPEVTDSIQFDWYQIAQTEAVLTFSNFIPGETAANLFAENLLKNELNSGEFNFVFASDYSYAGASVDPGIQDGLNAWFFNLMLGSSARVRDMQMLNLINQVRAEPESISVYISGDLATLFQENQQIYLLPTLQFQPMFFDGVLYELAEADVLTPEALSFGPDSRWVLTTDGGGKTWPGEWFQSLTAAASWENMDETRPVIDLFMALLFNELSVWPYNALIFSNHYTEAGAFVFSDTVETTESELELPETEDVESGGSGLVTLCAGSAFPASSLNLGEELVSEDARIYGLLFLDQDEDSFYSPGEELAGETVDVYPLTGENGMSYDFNVESAFSLITDNAGHFFLSLESGRYWVFETWKNGQVSRRTIYVDGDQFVKMSFSPSDLL
jgi:hypothetical protein